MTRRPRARDVSFRDPSRAFPAAEKHSCLAHFRIVRWTLTSDMALHLRIFMSVHPYKMFFEKFPFVLHFRRVVNRSFRVLLFSRLRTRSARNQNLVPPFSVASHSTDSGTPGAPCPVAAMSFRAREREREEAEAQARNTAKQRELLRKRAAKRAKERREAGLGATTSEGATGGNGPRPSSRARAGARRARPRRAVGPASLRVDRRRRQQPRQPPDGEPRASPRARALPG